MTEFLQRDPKEGAPASHTTEVRVAFDASAIYVAVNALDPEPSQGRGPAHTSRRFVALRLDRGLHRLVPRQAHRLSIQRQRCRASRPMLTGSTTRTAIEAGTRCGTSRSSRTPAGWQAEYPRALLAAAIPRRRHERDGLCRLARDRAPGRDVDMAAAGRERDGLRVVVWRAARRPARSDRRRSSSSCRSCSARSSTSPVASGNPLEQSPEPGGTGGLDLKYQVAPGLTLAGDDQSRLRPGGGRSGRRQSWSLRDVLPGASPVLRRRVGDAVLQRLLLFAPHRPLPATCRRSAARRIRRRSLTTPRFSVR